MDREAATILIVDDSAFMRRKFVSILNKAGYRAEEAGDGEEACVKYRQVRPAIVLMNVMLPGMDGVTATRRIRGADPNARVVVVTALKAGDVMRGAIRAGATAFLSKPVDPGLLVSVIRSLVPPGGALVGPTASVSPTGLQPQG